MSDDEPKTRGVNKGKTAAKPAAKPAARRIGSVIDWVAESKHVVSDVKLVEDRNEEIERCAAGTCRCAREALHRTKWSIRWHDCALRAQAHPRVSLERRARAQSAPVGRGK